MSHSVSLIKYKDLLQGEKHAVFSEFFALLSEYNAKFNLTAITKEDEVFEKHFLDSIAGESLFPKNANVVEIGSGAGFPSLPLKLIRDDLKFTLVESTGKKCEFLKTAVSRFSLKNVTVICARAEELARDSLYREKYDVCCARAVARMNTLAEYCLPFVKVNGSFIAYKADCEEEVKEAEHALSVLGGEKAECVPYTLPNGARTLVQVKKIRHTPPSYPRGQGKERRNPL